MKNSREDLEQLLLEAERRKGLKDLLWFSKEILGFKKIEKSVHSHLIKLLCNKTARKLFLLPRGSFKTTIATISYSIWRIIKDRDIRILIDGETFTKAGKYVSAIRELLEQDELLLHLYGSFWGDFWTRCEFTVSGRVEHYKEPTVTAGSIEHTKVGMHYNLIIADDLVSDQNIGTNEQLEKTILHYKYLLSLLEPNGILIIIGTRWHYNDLYGYIIDNEIGKHAVSFGWDYYLEKAIRDNGSLFFPHRLTQSFLDRMKYAQGSYLFSLQYQNEPVSQEDAVFPKKWITYYHQLPEHLRMTMTIDPALSTTRTADYTGIVICGTDKEKNIYVVDYVRARLNPTAFINKVFDLFEEYKPIAIGIETVIFQKILKYSLMEEAQKRGAYLPLRKLSGEKTKKDRRIQALVPYFEHKRIFIRPTMTELEDELLRYPKLKHDDLIDALSFQIELWRPIMESDTELLSENSFTKIWQKARKFYDETIGREESREFYIGNERLY